ncbi:WXG100 family type VII secretion target [Amycolatopsis sp. NPDC004378]
MPNDAGIKVNYATIRAAADDCQQTGGELQQAFDRLKDDLKPLITTWTGSAKDQYDQAQRTWDQSFEDLKQVLAQIAAALPQIADGYQATDNAVEGLF